MSWKHGIVVVAPDHRARRTLGGWFGKAGYNVAVASTFAEAKKLLGLGPDIVVSEVKLGEYNGLQIAAHAQRLGIATILIGPSDIALEHDAEKLGALYLSSIRKQDLLAVVEHELATHHHEHDARNGQGPPGPRRMMKFPLPGRSTVSN